MLYHLHWTPPADFRDPDGHLSEAIHSQMEAAWQDVLQKGSKFHPLISTGGEMTVTAIPFKHRRRLRYGRG